MTGAATLRPWPIPFDIAPLLALAGRRVVALASGDPFWFGAGAVLAAAVPAGGWVCHPSPSSFALAASRLGWALEGAICHGLHAAPFARLRPDLQNGARLIVTLRDGQAPRALAQYLTQIGFGASDLWVLSRLGGAHEAIVQTRADSFDAPEMDAPVMMAIAACGTGLPRGVGLPDDLFQSDGQIT
jgi:precorrin-6Y C5,15-methyltransferase (decarboxylating)